MKHFMKQFLAVVCTALLALCATPVQAQAVTSNVATVALTATVGESITVAVTNGSTFAFGSTGVLAPPTVNIAWNLAAGHSNFTLYAYFSSTTALTSGTNTLPINKLISNWDSVGGTTCGQVTPVSNSCASVAFTTNATLLGNASHTFNLWTNVQTDYTNLPVGNYTGTLNFAASAS
jgi:hypothetical protein